MREHGNFLLKFSHKVIIQVIFIQPFPSALSSVMTTVIIQNNENRVTRRRENFDIYMYSSRTWKV